jgi:hypothetical protein
VSLLIGTNYGYCCEFVADESWQYENVELDAYLDLVAGYFTAPVYVPGTPHILFIAGGPATVLV